MMIKIIGFRLTVVFFRIRNYFRYCSYQDIKP
ncbi:Uncharacterised protein [Serratia proteamaculans]|nr:Uncharacterised protein [Serratia proteamaculans]CAI1022488.1 Uncharacterised protein [Serratia proteamaculans]CAI1039052.1 Uncharacterised protein [Serratia proteamaculans]CAI1046138.1 Uncharacterised protein [Serratia proteamaculans]CAI2117650.1 Uncharacterised protein [Serratia proteamaculans]